MQNTSSETKRYGVRFAHGAAGERLYDAVGMKAEAGVGAAACENDFDSILPWAGMKRCNTEIVDGRRVPIVYEGEAGYSATDADVFVYVPLFYYHRSADDSECAVSMSPLEGYEAPAKFRRADGTLRDYTFLPAYTAGLENGVPVSRSGYAPFTTSLNGWMEITRGMGDLCIEGTKDDEIKNVLLDVEFATRDHQTVMMGAVNLPLFSDPFSSGACDGVTASSGSPESNTDGLHACKYRGIENPWGNQFRWRWDVLVKDLVPHVIDNPKKYAGGKVTDDYKALAYKMSDEDGWADKLGFDPAFPYIHLTTEITDEFEKSAFRCYYWQWERGIYALLVGGYVYNGRDAGSRYFNVNGSPSNATWDVGAALSPA